eukprot:TRINITY_DN574_c1_g1_i1.p1 TRINITY_DN574_c1_g1~~TRINITY_DN574_c1_g1_i1.p1  ORF type:complete len:328 (+),score=67.25 TRINITY_DN574_c1_g1_i1:186-1169(+)
MSSCCKVSHEPRKQGEDNHDFGIGYKEAFQKLTALQTLGSDKIIQKEILLLPLFAGLVPEIITLDGFRDLISKMTPNILVLQHRHPYEHLDSSLHKMADKCNIGALRALLAVGPEDLREKFDKFGMTALHKAVFSGNDNTFEAIQVLFLKDSRPEYREMVNKEDETALHAVCYNVGVDCLKLLLKGSRPEYLEMRDQWGKTPLHIAAYSNFFDGINVLLKEGPPDYREWVDKNGQTPLHLAAEYDHSKCVEVLVKDYNSEYFQMMDKDLKTPIQLATDESVHRILLKAKYEALISSMISSTLSVLDEKDTFWSDDSTVKETLLWALD